MAVSFATAPFCRLSDFTGAVQFQGATFFIISTNENWGYVNQHFTLIQPIHISRTEFLICGCHGIKRPLKALYRRHRFPLLCSVNFKRGPMENHWAALESSKIFVRSIFPRRRGQPAAPPPSWCGLCPDPRLFRKQRPPSRTRVHGRGLTHPPTGRK